ncbi:MAG TPA: TIGR04282 family arsenosugar biosynthesis glycosyltransferase, partial [Thermodesulfobacteriota bacterium]|nr:TIGR04282 family arsenosugar biosynthesis glycosyltransferase [Thermodesulfobacteriota bacterium]
KATPNHTLIIFVKYPEPGKVKTRLAAVIGKEKAAQIYKKMAETVISNVSRSGEYRTVIFFDPPERKKDFEKWIGNGYMMLPQEGESLGERIIKAFDKAFSLGAERAVIIGTDCVEISDELVSQAFGTLATVDVVLGPAEDGGYYLLGLKKLIHEIFNEINWGTNLVLNQTLEKVKKEGLKFQLLKTLKDIDTVNDLSDDLFAKIHRRDKHDRF